MTCRPNIFSLSPRAFEIIAKKLTNNDLFLLSTCSKKTFDLVRSTVAQFENPFVLKVVLGTELCIQLFSKGNPVVTWYFDSKRNADRFELEEKPARSVTMHSVHFNRKKTLVFREKCRGCYATVSSSMKDFLHLIEHIGHLLNPIVRFISIAPELTEHLEAIQSITIMKNCLEFWINPGTISHKAMHRALKGFNTKKVKLFCNVDRNYRLPLDHSCEFLSMHTSQVTNEHVNGFLWIWTQGCTRKAVDLEIIEKRIREDDEQHGVYEDKGQLQLGKWDWEKITNGLTDYVINYSKSQNHVVLRRETDKMRLKLHIQSGPWGSKLLVFNNRQNPMHQRRPISVYNL